MKTVHEYVQQGIPNLQELRDALRLAMQLEFATIPPYLCAQWSIKSDPDRIEAVLHRIAGQEMNHMALAGNILTAIGGVPDVGSDHFIPMYPMLSLPGGIAQAIPVGLDSLTPTQIEIFMQVEHPSFPPVAFLRAKNPATIGDFYDEIIKAIKELAPPIVPTAFAVPVPNVGVIEDIGDVIRSVEKIQMEGEGVRDSPQQPLGDRTTIAHYYSFKELHVQRRLIHDGEKWGFTGSPIRLPETYQLEIFDDCSPTSREFSRTLTLLLLSLQECWTSGATVNISMMFRLKLLGQQLIQRGICPTFVWDSSVG